MSDPLVLLIVNASGRNRGFKHPSIKLRLRYAPSLTEHVPFTRLQQKKNANLSLSTQTVNFIYFSRRVIFDSCFVIDFLESAN